MDLTQLLDEGWLQKLGHIYILKMFMPFPLKENNCFLAETDDGWMVIDTGVNLEQNRDLFTSALKAIGITFAQISAVYLTHYHHDHSGLAGWLQEKCDVPVFMPQADLVTWKRFIDTDLYLDMAIDECQLAGWPKQMAQELADNITFINPLLHPLPVLIPYSAGTPLRLQGQDYESIAVPGHTDGHIVFYSPASGVLFSGDNVVGHTILHLTDWPHTYLSNPCDEHLTALNDLSDLKIKTVIPGHGKTFADLTEKIERIAAHHDKRKSIVYEAVSSPMTAWEIADNIFKPNQYIHIRRLVLAETLAYLQSLVVAGRVERNLVNGSYIYRRT